MSGAGAVVAEAGGVNFFLDDRDEDGYLLLSPLGEVGKRFADFVSAHPKRGTPYTPFGLVLDFYHGSYSGISSAKLAFEHFRYTKSDHTAWHILDAFFPDGWESGGKDEKDVLTESPFGDTCDVILQNASLEVLESYPVLIFSGGIRLSAEEKKRFRSYVKHGGILLVNDLSIDLFPEAAGLSRTGAVKRFGKGFYIHYGDPTRKIADSKMLLSYLAGEFIPFTIAGKVHYLINRTTDAWILTLINNEGVTKRFREKPRVDDNETQQVAVVFTGITPATVSMVKYIDPRSESSVSLLNGSVELHLYPGEIAIFEFSSGE
jgi:hypothetical protein